MTSTIAKAGALVLTASAVPFAAFAEYPEQPVEFVVPFPPGDLEDVFTRLIADEFQATYDVPAAVVNKPGGGGGPFPGAAEVANAAPDGYTIGSFVIDIPVVGPLVGIPALDPNPFEPVGSFLTYPFVIVSSASQPYSDMEGLAAHAKENPVALGHFGSFLIPTQVTLAHAKLNDFAYDSDTAFDALDCNTLASGDADVINTNLQSVMPCMDDVTILATIGDTRIPLTPDVPTIKELTPELSASLWNGLFVHKDTPAEVREKIAVVAKKVIESDKAQQIAAETGAVIYWKDAAATTAQIDADTKTLGEIDALLAE
ncbi:tripartite tricarboxylate transporter substrate binding protein [Chachezhania antarctica]|uniref:tripartite tricarboxylate transporter substrate binding protein n=1 Tax=Chachezhania antarctica TaxID=2340860 RepID=UPI000EABF92A|nr:tripartite tricarboxylate transporter substrate binding protein [Chachezhania antarctica]|tara:strand:- start:2046 stop:2990 length:945 start_codon:yes stop_codon:yes gene_type:complete